MILCDIENRILQYMVNYINDNELVQDFTLVFDGCMIPKDIVKDVNMHQILKELEQEVLYELGYKTKLVIKPTDNIINISDDYKQESNEGLNFIKPDDESASEVVSLLDDLFIIVIMLFIF